MEIAERKFNVIQGIIELDEIVLEKIELFLESYHTDWYAKLTDQDKKELEEGISQANNKKFLNQESVLNKFSKWHSK